ncbi:hypothetical protein [Streptomyces sp. AGS-58]|uniref:hypothetical protein n=1 Tax=unclassified Streptomyces TaxID=2593676 RepID=UPI0035A2653B
MSRVDASDRRMVGRAGTEEGASSDRRAYGVSTSAGSTNVRGFTGTVRQAVGFAVSTVVFIGRTVHHGDRRHRGLRTMGAALGAGEPARAPR